MHNCKLVIFDWDGTLIDSIGKIVESVQHAARYLELPVPSDADAKAIIGLSLPEAMQTLFPAISNQQIDNLATHYKAYYLDEKRQACQLFSGVETLLGELKSEGKLLAVATGKARVGLERVWQETRTKHFFDGSGCGDEYQSKPHPEMLDNILKQFNLAPEQAVMVGDSHLDISMAKAAGIKNIGITHGAAQHHQMVSYQPDKVVSSIAELSKILLPD